jgi:diguanylate cyclase (GGDEF)-like protein
MHEVVSRTGAAVATWLCPTEMARMRFQDMHDRVRTARRIQALAMSLASLCSAVVFGWWIAVLVVMAVLVLAVLERAYRDATRPEIASFVSIVSLEIILALAVLGTGGLHSPQLAFLTIPVLMLAARFRLGVVVVGVAGALGVTTAVCVGAELLGEAPDAPGFVEVACFLAVLASLVAVALTLMSAEIASRGEAVVDQLTGLFNRKALHGRFTEAAAQARMIGAPVSLIICDLDHFKRVNDEYGHDRGDVVLREVAYRMRRTLRVFDLVYRLGGEEFLVLLPGQDEEAAAAVAERLVEGMRCEPVADLPLTMSAGVATLTPDLLDFDDLLKAADLALYAAKRAGRDRVCVASDVPGAARTLLA